MDEVELQDYVERVFRPFSEEHLISDLPAFLREVADIIAKK